MTEETQSAGRRFISRRDAIIIAAVVLAALGVMWYTNTVTAQDGNIAVISVDGKEVMRLNLAKYKNKSEYISLEEAYGVPVNFRVEDGGIRFVDVTCPDHICEAYGVCSREFDIAVCLPNRTMLVVYAPDDVPKVG